MRGAMAIGVGVGGAMGLYTSLLGPGFAAEFGAWTAAGVAVAVAVAFGPFPRPFLAGFASFAASGLAVGPVQAALLPQFLASHGPEVAASFEGSSDAAIRGQLVGFGVMAGLFWGVVWGAAAAAIRRIRGAATSGGGDAK
jgi:hypothetical protein